MLPIKNSRYATIKNLIIGLKNISLLTLSVRRVLPKMAWHIALKIKRAKQIINMSQKNKNRDPLVIARLEVSYLRYSWFTLIKSEA